ncbi:MAG: Hsp20/alpha crystallin family protein [Thaumarchaeota archaeon]|nr:Hsp20/alpha crystallin family protein [Candidatus Geocrenenecus arthurdayi]
MARSRRDDSMGVFLSRLFTIVLVILIALILISLTARFQRSLLGLALIMALGLLAFYWTRELRKAVSSRRAIEKYPVELIEKDELILLTAQVPGPEEEVRVELRGTKLLLMGGRGFRRIVKLPCRATILTRSYLNGVLHLQLRKTIESRAQ